MKKVTIMYRNSYHGGDGWKYYPMQIYINDNCPVCDAKRGETYNHNFCEDGDWFNVDKWDNTCGHVDTYRDCYNEYLKLRETKRKVRGKYDKQRATRAS